MDEKPMTDKAQTIYSAGIDIGSTTAKVIICDGISRVVFARYQRHQGETVKTVRKILQEALDELGNILVQVSVTGSAGMDAGTSEVNILNRLHFMIIGAREEMGCGAGVAVRGQMARPFFVPHIWPKYLADFDNYVSLEIEKWKSWVSGLGLWKKASDFMRR
ncbi:MAG: hypothetical protein JRJ13_19855 [Deltaproteobacteria bacterium]|nr:hypothetical protein [Deltaproteobacteria bacterium]